MPKAAGCRFLQKNTYFTDFFYLVTIFSETAIRRLKVTTFNQQIIHCKNLKAY